MGEHDTWFSFIPGFRELESQYVEQLDTSLLLGNKIVDLHYIPMAIFVSILCILLGLRYVRSLKNDPNGGVIPESRFNLRSIVEVVCDYALGMMAGMMGEKAARHFLPFIGTFAFFIMFGNLIGLVPGFLAPTDSVNTTAACAILVFIATHVYGLKENGWDHIKHLMGPIWWLAPLMFPIEVISHIVRPVSLALRLAGNMIGDHKVVTLFIGLTFIVVPVPIMALGVIVCMVQTLVFCLLSVVYIAMAIEKHDDHAEAH